MTLMKFIPEKIVSLLLLMLGIIYLLAGQSLSLGTLRNPGEGLVPLIMGGLFVGFALITLLRKPAIINEKLDKTSSQRVFKLAAALIGYILLMPFLGFKITTFLVTLYSGRVLGNDRWSGNIIFSLAVVGVSSLLFQIWLQLPLPEIFQ